MKIIAFSMGAILIVAAAATAMLNSHPVYADKENRCSSAQYESGATITICAPKDLNSGHDVAQVLKDCRGSAVVNKCSESQTGFGSFAPPPS